MKRLFHTTALAASLVGVLVSSFVTHSACADEFTLVGGGHLSGELLNPDVTPRVRYLVALENGGRIALDPAQVTRVVIKSDEEKEYDERLENLTDTIDDHWALAQWCLENHLRRQRVFHLGQVLRHDTDHTEARVALGYGNAKRENGRWMTQEEFLRAQGLVRQGGRWILPQQLALETEREQRELLEKEWIAQLRRWRGWLGNERRREESLQEIRTIRDPGAARALANGLADEDESSRVKLEYIKVLGRMNTATAISALIDGALKDDDEEVRLSCIDQLENRGSQSATRAFIRALESSDNTKVNRAAIGLGRLGDETAQMPLIHALNTKHRFRTGSGGSGSISPSFDSNGGGGLSAGGGPTVVEREVQNRAVHGALISLTHGAADHQYNEEAWINWYARVNTPANVNLRRSQ